MKGQPLSSPVFASLGDSPKRLFGDVKTPC